MKVKNLEIHIFFFDSTSLSAIPVPILCLMLWDWFGIFSESSIINSILLYKLVISHYPDNDNKAGENNLWEVKFKKNFMKFLKNCTFFFITTIVSSIC